MPKKKKTKNKNIQIVDFKDFRWYNISKNSKKEIKFLKDHFRFNDADLNACLPPLQRPKSIKYPDYIFMILLFPYYDKKTKAISVTEIDFFISTNYFITVHDNTLEPLKKFTKDYTDNDFVTGKGFGMMPLHLLYELLDNLFEFCFPMLTHIGQDIDKIEEKIFSDFSRNTIKEILLIKRNIVSFRKALQAHKSVLRKMMVYSQNFFDTRNLEIYFENLTEKTKDIWDLLENYFETINAVYSTNESLVTFRLSEIMKMLTIISVFTFPLTLIATTFATDTLGSPLEHHPYGFWIIVGIMLIVAGIMYLFFKRKNWF